MAWQGVFIREDFVIGGLERGFEEYCRGLHHKRGFLQSFVDIVQAKRKS